MDSSTNNKARLEPVPAQPAKLEIPWVAIAWIAALLLAVYFQVVATMVKEWATDESMGHGFFVPVVAGYLIWQRREEVFRLKPKPHWLGHVAVVLGFVFMIVGLLGADFFVQRVGFMLSLYGAIVACCGFGVLWTLAFPMILLLFMIRIPLFIYSQITFPLQILASQVAEWALALIGIPVLRDGNILELPSQRLSVVEACSGIRSLISLGFLSLVYGYFFERRKWLRALLFLLTIPIAIVANAFRVTLTGILSEVDKDMAEGIYHSLEGWVIFMVALAVLILVHKTITLAIRPRHAGAEPDEAAAGAEPGAGGDGKEL